MRSGPDRPTRPERPWDELWDTICNFRMMGCPASVHGLGIANPLAGGAAWDPGDGDGMDVARSFGRRGVFS